MGLFSRYQALKIQALQYDIFVHPLHDPGVFHDAVNFLRLYTRTYRYALVFLDHEGSGQEQLSSAEMSQMLRQKLEKNGWEQRVEVIVLAPELEIWLWINSPNMAAAVGWKNYAELKSELIQQKFWTDDALKPQQPKEAFEHILKKAHLPKSSSIFYEIAQKVNFFHCQDPAFLKLQLTLRNWFQD